MLVSGSVGTIAGELRDDNELAMPPCNIIPPM